MLVNGKVIIVNQLNEIRFRQMPSGGRWQRPSRLKYRVFGQPNKEKKRIKPQAANGCGAKCAGDGSSLGHNEDNEPSALAEVAQVFWPKQVGGNGRATAAGSTASDGAD